MLYKFLVVLVALVAASTAQAQNLLTNGGFEDDPTPFPDLTDDPPGWHWREFNGYHQQVFYIPDTGTKHLHSVDFENRLQQSVPQTVQPGDVLTLSARVLNVNDLDHVDGDYNANETVDGADYVQWRNGGPLENEGGISPGEVDEADYEFWKAQFGNMAAGGKLEIQNAAHQVLAASANANTVPVWDPDAGSFYYDLSVTLDVSTLTPELQATIIGSQPLAVIHILGNDPMPFNLDSLNIYYDNVSFTIASASALGTAIVGVPEPGCLLLLASGLTGLSASARRPRAWQIH